MGGFDASGGMMGTGHSEGDQLETQMTYTEGPQETPGTVYNSRESDLLDSLNHVG